MSRIPYPSPENLSPKIRERVGENTPNVTRMLAGASEGVYFGFNALAKGLMRTSPLDPKLRELAILRVGYISNATYELFQHEPCGRFVGLTDAQIAAIKAGDTSSGQLDDEQVAVLNFVDDIVHNVRASDETLAAVRNYLDDVQLIDLIIVTGNYMTVCRFLETTGIEIDEEAIDWDVYTSTP
ncbi:MAG: carboxymuconolactone decarboxylase family protein [Sphingomonadaceae bacterium]|nr:carboxymuconolactone decarboxylase family protein [Sphingomonadaceae bacterium]